MSDILASEPLPRMNYLRNLRTMIERDREAAISDMLLALREAGVLRCALGSLPSESGHERPGLREAVKTAAVKEVLRLIESAGEDVIRFRRQADEEFDRVEIVVVRRTPDTERGLA